MESFWIEHWHDFIADYEAGHSFSFIHVSKTKWYPNFQSRLSRFVMVLLYFNKVNSSYRGKRGETSFMSKNVFQCNVPVFPFYYFTSYVSISSFFLAFFWAFHIFTRYFLQWNHGGNASHVSMFLHAIITLQWQNFCVRFELILLPFASTFFIKIIVCILN